MDIASTDSYVNILNDVIKLCSALFPLAAILLRKLHVIRPDRDESSNTAVAIGGVIGFGCLGSIIGLALLTASTVGFVCFLWVKLVEIQSRAALGLGEFNLSVLGQLASKSNLICLGASIVTTLLTFGGRDRAKGLAFLAGGCLGGTVAFLFLLSLAFH